MVNQSEVYTLNMCIATTTISLCDRFYYEITKTNLFIELAIHRWTRVGRNGDFAIHDIDTEFWLI